MLSVSSSDIFMKLLYLMYGCFLGYFIANMDMRNKGDRIVLIVEIIILVLLVAINLLGRGALC